MSLMCFQIRRMILLWHHNYRNNDVNILRVADAFLQHCCCLSITGILQKRSASLIVTDLVTSKITKIAHRGSYLRIVFEYFCVLLLTAHCTYRHILWILFFLSFAFCSNIKSSPVITDHYTCCYITWTDILHNEIMLLLKEVNKRLLKFGLA